MPTIGGKEYDPARLVGIARSYGVPDLAWLAGPCLGFTPGGGSAAEAEWEEAVQSLGLPLLVLGPTPEGHLTLVSPRAVREALYNPEAGTLRVSAGGRPFTVGGVTPGQYADFVGGMPADSWHTPLAQRKGGTA